MKVAQSNLLCAFRDPLQLTCSRTSGSSTLERVVPSASLTNMQGDPTGRQIVARRERLVVPQHPRRRGTISLLVLRAG